jgi:hypothetical protein
MQACDFRGHHESSGSSNCGNIIEVIKYSTSLNKDIAKFVLENTLGNAKYTSLHIEKKILNILAKKMRNKIREDIEDAKF